MTFTYTNTVTGERTKREGLSNVGQAWALSQEVCEQMNWNHEMFADDVMVRKLK
jgi:hypothetical protein